MEILCALAIWGGAIIVSYKMAERRELDTTYAVVGGLVFGWLTPLYYILFKRIKK